MTLTSASDAERQADNLRNQLASTVDELAEQLTPSHLASYAVDAAPEWVRRYWGFARTPEGLAIACGFAALCLVTGVARNTARKHQRALDLTGERERAYRSF